MCTEITKPQFSNFLKHGYHKLKLNSNLFLCVEIFSPVCLKYSESLDFECSWTQSFPENEHFLFPDKRTYRCVSGDNKCAFFRKVLFSCYLRFEICLFTLSTMFGPHNTLNSAITMIWNESLSGKDVHIVGALLNVNHFQIIQKYLRKQSSGGAL